MAHAVLLAILLLAPLLASAAPPASASSDALRFGMAVRNVDALVVAGAEPDMAVFWVGPWMHVYGWGGFDRALDDAVRKGVTPVIHFWYWGDDISASCVQSGCTNRYHGVALSRADWDAMAATLQSKLQSRLDGREAIVIVETEFNKKDIDGATYAPTFDALLARKLDQFASVPGVDVVVSFGNWRSENWDRFPLAIGSSDMLGFQTMRASTKDSDASYQAAVDAVRAASSHLHVRYDKATILTDLALSTYPSSKYERMQAAEITELFAREDELRDVGLRAVLYRDLVDNPKADTRNYYGEAERHWGFVRADASQKLALAEWVEGVRAARAEPAPTATRLEEAANVAEDAEVTTVDAAVATGEVEPDAEPVLDPPPAVEPAPAVAAWSPFSNVKGNEWWIEARVAGSPTDVSARVNGGTSVPLALKSWGSFAVSTRAPAGLTVEITARYANGTVATQPFRWTEATPLAAPTVTSGTTTTATSSSSSTTSTTTTTSAAWNPFTKVQGNEWWVQANVAGGPSRVTASVNGSAAVALTLQSWGGYAVSTRAPSTSEVRLTAHYPNGTSATASYRWTAATLLSVGGTNVTSTTTSTSSFSATFSCVQAKNYWVQTCVTSKDPLSRVEVRVNGGSWQTLALQSWGGYAKSFPLAAGSAVEFRATNTKGATATSSVYRSV